MQKNFSGIILYFYSVLCLGQTNIDQQVHEQIMINALRPLEKITTPSPAIVKLGATLFSEKLLSGNKDISCSTCHHPLFGTADSLPFSIGTGGHHLGPNRRQEEGELTKRHSPHLFNLGYPQIEHMFWDGRVHYDFKSKIFTTPEPGLNGVKPLYSDITSVLTSALAAQTIFPLINDLEMRGSGNDIANASDNRGSWQVIMKRLLSGPKKDLYKDRFTSAFPNTKNFNIGHLGEALAKFISYRFNATNTPFDRYLRGDKSAMNLSEKRGFLVFAKRGKCIQCHSGPHLSNFEFKTVGTPQVTSTSYQEPYDEGRYEVTKKKRDLFKYKTPALRQLAITAPYMHNGAFQTIEEVVEHYSAPQESLRNYTLNQIDLSSYNDHFVIDRDPLRDKLRINLISIGEVRRGIQFTDQEKKDLVNFLKDALLDDRFHPKNQLLK